MFAVVGKYVVQVWKSDRLVIFLLLVVFTIQFFAEELLSGVVVNCEANCLEIDLGILNVESWALLSVKIVHLDIGLCPVKLFGGQFIIIIGFFGDTV